MQRTLAVASVIAFALSTPAFAQGVDRLREDDAVWQRERITDIDKLSAEAGIRQPPGERERYGARIGGRGADDDRQADDPLSGLGAGIADDRMRIQREMMQPGGGITAPGAGTGAGRTGFEEPGSAAQGPGGMGMGAGGAGGALGGAGGGAAGAGSSASGGSGGGGSGGGGSGGGGSGG